MVHNSKTVQYIRMKLGKLIGSDNMHMYSKGKTLHLIIIELCPFFDSELTDERWRSLCGALVIRHCDIYETRFPINN